MIAAWIVYSLVVGALLVAAAHFAERILHAHGRQTRRVWAVAAVGAAVLPVLAFVLRDAPPAFELDGVVVPTSATAGVVMSSVDALAALDGALLWLWIAASAALALHFSGGAFLAHRRSRRWRREVLDGEPVLVSDDVGPAVVGLLRGRIVLPGWALEAPAGERSMMVRHEKEHLEAGDPRLVAAAAMLLVAVPWNAAIWYATRRLRLAIEIDCDRRVMRSGEVDMRSYAELLLAVGARRAPRYGVAFSVGRPFLEQRIDRMTGAGRHDRRRAAMALSCIAIALAAAWSIPQPVRATNVSGEQLTCPAQTYELNKELLSWAQRST